MFRPRYERRVGIDFQAEDPAAIKQTWDYCEEQVRKVTGK
jgi:hypothetical protein